jgi:hypothetical protein
LVLFKPNKHGLFKTQNRNLEKKKKTDQKKEKERAAATWAVPGPKPARMAKPA